jgi:hypothetical protein
MKGRTMKLSKAFMGLVLLLIAFAGVSQAQTALTQTTLSAAVNSSSNRVVVASATGVTANSTMLFIDNEALFVTGVNGTTLSVVRGQFGTKGFGHISGAGVLLGPPNAFISYEPSGSCTNGQGLFLYSPVVNVVTGNQWLCSTVTGKIIPGFLNVADPPGVSTAVASAAGVIVPSGPLFHITGALAITGFTIPVGFDPKGGGQICAIPDGTFTTTAAGNIALASTAVVSKTLCWTYDANTAKFYPAY